MSYKWKPSASQRKAFAIKMQDADECKAYKERKAAKRLYDNWKDKDFIPTKDQYDFCMSNMHLVDSDQRDAFNTVIYGFTCNEKVNHEYIHIVNQLRRKEIEFNNYKESV